MKHLTLILIAAATLLFGAAAPEPVWAETEQETIAKAIDAAEKARDASAHAKISAKKAQVAGGRASRTAEMARKVPLLERQRIKFSSGSYEGEVHNGTMDGLGVFTFPDGARFEGRFKNGEIGGYGSIIIDGNRFDGNHSVDVINSHMTFSYTNGERYEGETQEGVQSGTGIFYYESGNRYQGENLDGEQIGYGIMFFANGDRYEGEISGIKTNGYGAYFFVSGRVDYAYWQDGVPDTQRFVTRAKGEAEREVATVAAAEPVRLSDIEENYIARANFNIREAPDAASRRVAGVLKGRPVRVRGKVENKDWYAVTFGEYSGYVRAGLLQPGIQGVDQTPPKIEIASAIKVHSDSATVHGRVTDNVRVALVTVGGVQVAFSSNGDFTFKLFVPRSGREVMIVAIDDSGNEFAKRVTLTRERATTAVIGFDPLDPTGIASLENENAIALVIGIGDYESAPDALYADRDAEFFADYVRRAFGVPDYNIKLLLDKDASRLAVKRLLKRWLPGTIRAGKTDVYVFFAGHGLASKNGKDLYLLPENGLPDLLEDSAIMRNEIYDVLTAANPRSVTVFLDTCFSGGTRGGDMLIADARAISVTAKDDRIAPDRFTIFSASALDEVSSSLPEAQHGLFSYFLMKGMEGEADANSDSKITAGELHAYISDNVSRQALRLGRVQTPQLQGDAERVMVAW